MNREGLHRIIRAAAAMLGEDTVVIIGSQSILASFHEFMLPNDATMSAEADILAFDDNDEAKADKVDGLLGEASHFSDKYGIYADGVSPWTASLPTCWDERLVRIEDPESGAVGLCLHPEDLCVAKVLAGRAKSRPGRAGHRRSNDRRGRAGHFSASRRPGSGRPRRRHEWQRGRRTAFRPTDRHGHSPLLDPQARGVGTTDHRPRASAQHDTSPASPALGHEARARRQARTIQRAARRRAPPPHRRAARRLAHRRSRQRQDLQPEPRPRDVGRPRRSSPNGKNSHSAIVWDSFVSQNAACSHSLSCVNVAALTVAISRMLAGLVGATTV